MTSTDSLAYKINNKTMCTRFSVCGKRHRDKKGRFIVVNKPLMKLFFVISLTMMVSMIGVNTIGGWAKSLEQTFLVENSNAQVLTIDEEDRIQSLIRIVYQKAKVYGVNGYQMERTIECESRFNNIQSTAYKNGVREESYGIAQIHLPSHPDVKKWEALDENFAIEWMAKNFNNPYVTWYAYNRKTDKCN